MSRILHRRKDMGFLDDVTKAVKTVNKVTRTINSVERAGKQVSNTVKKASKVVNGTTKSSTSKKTTSKSSSTTSKSTSKTSKSAAKKELPVEEASTAEVQIPARDTDYKKKVRLTEKSTCVVIESLPIDLIEFKSLPEAALSSPFDTAALTLLAFTSYQGRRELSLSMLEYLKGPSGLDEKARSIVEAEMERCSYAPRSYFVGAVPSNDYTPAAPYTVELFEGNDSYLEEGYASLYVKSSGADDPRKIVLRQSKSGEWYLWDQDVLDIVKAPEGDVWV